MTREEKRTALDPPTPSSQHFSIEAKRAAGSAEGGSSMVRMKKMKTFLVSADSKFNLTKFVLDPEQFFRKPCCKLFHIVRFYKFSSCSGSRTFWIQNKYRGCHMVVSIFFIPLFFLALLTIHAALNYTSKFLKYSECHILSFIVLFRMFIWKIICFDP